MDSAEPECHVRELGLLSERQWEAMEGFKQGSHGKISA